MYLGMYQIQTFELAMRMQIEYSQTIFHEAEVLLNDTDAWEALQFVASNKRMDSYWSVMDFLFCELAGSPWTTRCKAFYNGGTRKVVDWLTAQEIEYWDKFLCAAINHAKLCLEQHRWKTWTKFRLEVIKLAA